MKKNPLLLASMIAPFLIVGAMTNDLFLPYLPFLQTEFHCLSTVTHLSVTLPMLLMGGLGQLYWGYQLDRISVSRILAMTVLSYLIGSIICAFTASWSIFLGGRMLQSFGACGMVVASIFFIRIASEEPQTSLIIGRLMGLVGATPIYAPFLMAGLTALYPGYWRVIFIFMTFYALLLGALLFRNYRFIHTTEATVEKQQHDQKSFFQKSKEIFQNLEFRQYGTIPCLVLTGLFMFFSFSTYYLTVVLGLPMHQVRLIFAIHAGIYLLSPFVLLPIFRTIKAELMIQTALSLILVLSLALYSLAHVMSLSSFLTLALPLPALYGLIYGPSIQRTLSTIPQHRAGLATSLLSMCQFVTASTCSSVFIIPPHVELVQFCAPIILMATISLIRLRNLSAYKNSFVTELSS